MFVMLYAGLTPCFLFYILLSLYPEKVKCQKNIKLITSAPHETDLSKVL